jgi:hypothetical protein
LEPESHRCCGSDTRIMRSWLPKHLYAVSMTLPKSVNRTVIISKQYISQKKLLIITLKRISTNLYLYFTVYSTVQYSTAYSTVQYSIQYSTVQHTVQYSTVYSTVQYSIQYSTVQHTVQYSTVYSTVKIC